MLHIFDLFCKLDLFVVGLIDHIAHYVGQLRDDKGRFIRLDGRQIVQVVQRIEKEVGVYLSFQKFELGVKLLLFQLPPAGIEFQPIRSKPQQTHKGDNKQIADDPLYNHLQTHRASRPCPGISEGKIFHFEPKESECSKAKDKRDNKPPGFFPDQEYRDQIKVVYVGQDSDIPDADQGTQQHPAPKDGRTVLVRADMVNDKGDVHGPKGSMEKDFPVFI